MTISTKKKYIILVCTIAALGGLLFGLDQGFINTALPLIQSQLHLNAKQASNFSAILLWGAIVGSLLSGIVSRILGRRNTLLATAILFSLCAGASMLTTHMTLLMTYRFILGVSVGVASFAAPLYLSEAAPTKWRGAFVSMYQLMITVGIFAIFVSNSIISHHFHRWQPMFYAILIPAIIMIIGLFVIPKTPRWLMLKGKNRAALITLRNIRLSNKEAHREFRDIESTVNAKDRQNFFQSLKSSVFFKVLLLGVTIQIFQQLTGINAVIYYSTSIFLDAGVHDPMLATAIVGLVNMTTTILAVSFVDKLGRKPILYAGYSLMAAMLFIGALIFHHEAIMSGALSTMLKAILVAATVVFIFSFAFSAGPIAWLLCSEIFPLDLKECGMTITTSANWLIAALVVNFTLPFMQYANGKPNPGGGAYVFLFFALACVAFLFVLKFFIPETNNVALEQIEKNLYDGKALRHLGKSDQH
ncbi:MAG: sugar porter family MFS transporter [Pseudomonadota bacterium]